MQGTQVQALVREDPTCRGATKPMHHSYWACILEPASHNYWAHVPQLLKPAHIEPVFCNKRRHSNEKPVHTAVKSSPRSPQLEKAHTQQQRPKAAPPKIYLYIYIYIYIYTYIFIYVYICIYKVQHGITWYWLDNHGDSQWEELMWVRALMLKLSVVRDQFCFNFQSIMNQEVAGLPMATTQLRLHPVHHLSLTALRVLYALSTRQIHPSRAWMLG